MVEEAEATDRIGVGTEAASRHGGGAASRLETREFTEMGELKQEANSPPPGV